MLFTRAYYSISYIIWSACLNLLLGHRPPQIKTWDSFSQRSKLMKRTKKISFHCWQKILVWPCCSWSEEERWRSAQRIMPSGKGPFGPKISPHIQSQVRPEVPIVSNVVVLSKRLRHSKFLFFHCNWDNFVLSSGGGLDGMKMPPPFSSQESGPATQSAIYRPQHLHHPEFIRNMES